MIDLLRRITYESPGIRSAYYPHNKRCVKCQKPTKEGKEFCVDHVYENPYVQEIMAQLSKRQEEDERILSGTLSTQEIIATERCNEVLMFVILSDENEIVQPEGGGITTPMLAVNFEGNEPLVEACVTALWKAGKVKLVRYKIKKRGETGFIVQVRE